MLLCSPNGKVDDRRADASSSDETRAVCTRPQRSSWPAKPWCNWRGKPASRPASMSCVSCPPSIPSIPRFPRPDESPKLSSAPVAREGHAPSRMHKAARFSVLLPIKHCNVAGWPSSILLGPTTATQRGRALLPAGHLGGKSIIIALHQKPTRQTPCSLRQERVVTARSSHCCYRA